MFVSCSIFFCKCIYMYKISSRLLLIPSAPFTSEAYPSCTVTDIRFCFDVHKLMKLDLERYCSATATHWTNTICDHYEGLVWGCFLAGAKQWKAGCILLQKPKKRGRSWSRRIHVLRYSAATSVALKRYVLWALLGFAHLFFLWVAA